MNRKMMFGYDILGNHNLVKLNVGLNRNDQSNLGARYGLIVSEGRNGLCRIEGGECGEGPLDAIAVFNAFKDENFCRCLLEEDLQLANYQSHPSIKAPLSN